MMKTQRHQRSAVSPARRLALVTVPLLVLGVTACGDMTAPEGATTTPPAVTDSSTTDPTASPGSGDVAAVIGGWAARYGSARNDVESAMQTLGSAAANGPAAVKPAATDALAALKAAHDVPICPDPATEKAFRATLDELHREGVAADDLG